MKMLTSAVVDGHLEEEGRGVPFTLAMLERALLDQADMTAVERFAQQHESETSHLHAKSYEALLPISRPASGEQYAFEVDLDLCTGCKACVSACHMQNGLDSGESFRRVGMLHGGSEIAPFQQTVTSACHHCLDPACLEGCPVKAYDKDPVTGIVRHLDDQCIGCQYCVFTCPYEVPRYHADKGIVRKCDMCRDRLAVGEAPACVQACPNGAIAIRVVKTADVAAAAESESFLPGTPSSSITQPTTTYKTNRVLPKNLKGADHHSLRPAHGHGPLAVMLVLTQLSVGAFVVERFVHDRLSAGADAVFAPLHAVFAMVVGLLAIGGSVSHLGRPLYAYRALLGLRTSWLSREILGFGLFAGLALTHALATLFPSAPVLSLLASHGSLTSGLVAGFGAFGVFCSVMVYHVTRRAYWNMAYSGTKFALTSLVLGLATTLFTMVLADTWSPSAELDHVAGSLVAPLAYAMIAKLLVELWVLSHLRDHTTTDLRRTAKLLTTDLFDTFVFRVVIGLIGGIAIPVLLVYPHGGGAPASALVGAVLVLALTVAGELMERSLFFRALASLRMPGGLT
jgi:formate dehydrogenase iron-sulfur subunit